MNWINALREFHAAADLGDRRDPGLPLRDSPLGNQIRSLRRKLLREEFKEYEDAEDDNDLIEVADALADIVYVVIGTALEYGIPLDRVFAEVHRSNMTKCINGKMVYREDGKIMKPETYSPPNIERALFTGETEP